MREIGLYGSEGEADIPGGMKKGPNAEVSTREPAKEPFPMTTKAGMSFSVVDTIVETFIKSHCQETVNTFQQGCSPRIPIRVHTLERAGTSPESFFKNVLSPEVY